MYEFQFYSKIDFVNQFKNHVTSLEKLNEN